jgi:hypothetical protein
MQFEENCISLLVDSYNKVTNKSAFKELTENNITAQLIGLIKSNPLRTDLNISINREAYNDTDATYTGIAEADESPRIDMKYTVWNSNVEFEYFIEAKNVAENNWKKSTVTTPVNAKELQKRYISTGIQNFITGRYPHGCLVGYVTEGIPGNIVANINTLLTTESRVKENLTQRHGGFVQHYISSHTGSSINELNHFFLEFT